MKELWAPWRIEYIKRIKEEGCFLCKSFECSDNCENLVLKRSETCAIIINRYPYNGGHLMIAPLRHVDSLKGMTADERSEMMELTIDAIEVLKKAMRPDGFNIGINMGEAAGAGLKDHIHMHVVPRWTGDTNFMPVLADTKVVPQSLIELWEQLHELI